jgi:hypothetical protein
MDTVVENIISIASEVFMSEDVWNVFRHNEYSYPAPVCSIISIETQEFF